MNSNSKNRAKNGHSYKQKWNKIWFSFAIHSKVAEFDCPSFYCKELIFLCNLSCYCKVVYWKCHCNCGVTGGLTNIINTYTTTCWEFPKITDTYGYTCCLPLWFLTLTNIISAELGSLQLFIMGLASISAFGI